MFYKRNLKICEKCQLECFCCVYSVWLFVFYDFWWCSDSSPSSQRFISELIWGLKCVFNPFSYLFPNQTIDFSNTHRCLLSRLCLLPFNSLLNTKSKGSPRTSEDYQPGNHFNISISPLDDFVENLFKGKLLK